MLFDRFGGRCWACDFVAEGPRAIEYLELDHINPKSGGGHDHLDNRALLCSPCNRHKSDMLTLKALRYEFLGGRKGAKTHPIDLDQANAWARALEMKEVIRREHEAASLFD